MATVEQDDRVARVDVVGDRQRLAPRQRERHRGELIPGIELFCHALQLDDPTFVVNGYLMQVSVVPSPPWTLTHRCVTLGFPEGAKVQVS